MSLNTRRQVPALPPLQVQLSSPFPDGSGSGSATSGFGSGFGALSSPFIGGGRSSSIGSAYSFTTNSDIDMCASSRRDSDMSFMSSRRESEISLGPSSAFSNSNNGSSSAASCFSPSSLPHTPLPFADKSPFGGVLNLSTSASSSSSSSILSSSSASTDGGFSVSSVPYSAVSTDWLSSAPMSRNDSNATMTDSCTNSGMTTPMMYLPTPTPGPGFTEQLERLIKGENVSRIKEIRSQDSIMSGDSTEDDEPQMEVSHQQQQPRPQQQHLHQGPQRSRKRSEERKMYGREPDWDEREEGILQSFLMHPLHPLSVPYPPGELPPAVALDELTNQIMYFHSKSSSHVLGHKSNSISVSISGLPSSVSAPGNLSDQAHPRRAAASSAAPPPTTRPKHSHRRTHSASGIPWKHSWKATRKKLFEIARKEAIGLGREDRWKDREASRLRGISAAVFTGRPFNLSLEETTDSSTDAGRLEPSLEVQGGGTLTPTTASMSAYEFGFVPPALGLSQALADAANKLSGPTSIPGTDGRSQMQRARSALMLEVPVEEDEEALLQSPPQLTTPPACSGEQSENVVGPLDRDGLPSSSGPVRLGNGGLGQVLRLSTTLQRNARNAPKSASLCMTPAAGPVPLPSVSPACASAPAPAPMLSTRPTSAGTALRPPSLLQRGRSFTADNFESYMASLTTPSQEKFEETSGMHVDGGMAQVEMEDPDRTPTKKQVLDAFSFQFDDSPSSNGSASGPATPEDINSFQNQGHAHGPDIVLIDSSPSPERQHATRQVPTSPSPAGNGSDYHDLSRKIKPRLVRSHSVTNDPSASSNNGSLACTARGFDLPPLTLPASNDFVNKVNAFALPIPQTKRPRMNLTAVAKANATTGLDVFNSGWNASDASGLRSPFDDGSRKEL